MGNIPFLHRHVTLAASGGARSQKRFARAIWRKNIVEADDEEEVIEEVEEPVKKTTAAKKTTTAAKKKAE